MNVSIKYMQENKEHNKILMAVTFYEEIESLGYSADLTVWVPASDSRSELEALAKSEAHNFLSRVLSGHS